MITLAVRGAIQIKENTQDSIQEGTLDLVRTMMEQNHIDMDDLISLQFTQTVDLDRGNPAGALRDGTGSYKDVPLFCAQEPHIVGAMNRVIRVLALFHSETKRPLRGVYLGNAGALRPDLINQS